MSLKVQDEYPNLTNEFRPPDFAYLEGFDPISMQDYVDFFNFMSYDLHGPWEGKEPSFVLMYFLSIVLNCIIASDLRAFVRPQTSVIDINTDLLPIWFDGVDPGKINLGIAYYGRGYTLANTSCTDIGCPYTAGNLPGQVNFIAVVGLLC